MQQLSGAIHEASDTVTEAAHQLSRAVTSTLHRVSTPVAQEDDSDSESAAGATLSARRSRSKRVRSRRSRKQRRMEPEMHQTKEEFLSEWGLQPEEEEKLVRKMLDRLRKEGLVKADDPPYYHDYYVIRRFMRARQHDETRAHDMLVKHFAWRREVGADDILNSFNFHERDSFLTIYPQGYHKTDKMGRPVYIQKMGSIDLRKILEVTTEERMIKFRIQEWERCLRYIMPVCSIKAERKIEQTFAILDVQGVGLRHLTGEVKRLMAKVTTMDQDNYPEMLGHTCIINAPAVFKMLWAVVKPMLDARTQAKVEVCPRDYAPALLHWVDPENLPTYLGGTSTATLLDDAGPWHQDDLVMEVEVEYRRSCGLVSDGEETSSVSDGDDLRSSTGGGPGQEGGAGASHARRGAHAAAGTAEQAVTLSDMDESSALRLAGLRGASRLSTAPSEAGDDAFHSPRSEMSSASFMSALGAFSSDAGASTAANLDQASRQLSAAAGGGGGGRHSAEQEAGAAPLAGTRATIRQANGSAGYVEGRPTSPSKAATLLARVASLEQKVREASEKLGVPPPPAAAAPAAVPGGGGPAGPAGEATLVGRIASLEYAMDALLQAQEAEVVKQQQPAAEASSSCCGCCCVQ